LWGSIATTHLVLTIAKDHRSIGAMPLLRQLLETTFTLKHLLNTNKPDETAARSLVWDFLNADEKIAINLPKTEIHLKQPVFSADRAIEELCAELESLGESPDLVRRIYAEAKTGKKRHWHWTGRGPGAMIRELLLEGPAAIVDKFETNIFRYAWADISVESHATPRWHIPGITFLDNGPLDFDNPLAQDDQKAARLASMASYFLKRSRQYAAEYYGGRSKEEV
jgi:hypothetical protein